MEPISVVYAAVAVVAATFGSITLLGWKVAAATAALILVGMLMSRPLKRP